MNTNYVQNMSAFEYREKINYEISITKTKNTQDGIKNSVRLNGGVNDTELCNLEHKL